MRAARLLAALLLACVALPSLAGRSVFVEELTWTELRDDVAAGRTTIIVPIGGTEQNGPHMTLGKHNARVSALAGRIAGALGNALVAPVVAYVPEGGLEPPTAHMRFPGTVTVPVAAFEATIESIARSFRLHGFRDVVLIGDHGGYEASLVAVARRLDRAWASTPARAHAIVEYHRAGDAAFRDVLPARGFPDEEIGTHAGLADTSLALAVDASTVRQERLAAMPSVAQGTYGDPRRASAEPGAAGVNAIVAAGVEAIRRATRPR